MLTEPTGAALSQLAEQAWARFGGQSTLLFEGQQYTNAELGAWSRRLGTGLRAAGVCPGDRVIVCMANCPEVLVAYHAIWRIGAVVTPVLFLLSEDELRHVLVDSGAVLALTTPEFLAKVVAAASGLDVRVAVTGPASGDILSLDELADGPESPLAPRDPADMAALLYTGGTTGRAKGVVLSHDALSFSAWSITLAGTEQQDSVALVPLPLAHVYGLMVSAMGLHAVHPGRVVLMRWFEPSAWLRLVEQERVQTGAVVPTMLRLLLDQPLEDHDLSSLRRLGSGSAPLPRDVHAEWARRVPNVEITEGYGCTETGALATCTPPGAYRIGSVGPAAPGVELRIELPDGSDAPTGADGEVCVRSPSLMTGYWHAADAGTERGAVHDGWFHTGDVARLDEDGYLYVVDRLKDVIIRGGFNVYPRDVEEVFMEHPDVANCAVVGRRDPEHGEEVVAYVQLKAGATASAAALREFGRAHLSAVKYPREVYLLEELPLTSVGKLDRKALRARTRA
jgi:long-chain acyl-CoA synthetase